MPSRDLISKKILESLRQVLPHSEMEYSLHVPSFTDDEVLLAKECIESGWVSYRSQFVEQFEETLSNYLGVPYVISTVNGTAALHLALVALGLQAGEEVLMPAFTFSATANAVVYCGATPHFVDSCEKNLGIHVEKLEDYLEKNTKFDEMGRLINKDSGKVIRGIIPVHIFGHPVDMGLLTNLAERYHLWVLEDAAESLGSLYGDKHTGTLGKVGVTSFNGNKIITTGGGGAIFLKDEALASRIRHLSTTAKVAHSWEFWHDEVGYNYRMPGINAALGCAQMKKLNGFLEKKRKLALSYQTVFRSIDEVTSLEEPRDSKSNYWLNVVLLKKPYTQYKNSILEYLHHHKIFCRGAWVPMHRLPAFQNCPRMDLSIAEDLYNRVINLPSSPFLIQ